MKSIYLFLFMTILVCIVASCGNNKRGGDEQNDAQEVPNNASSAIPDTTIYGICGEETAMHKLQLITDTGEKIMFDISDEEENQSDVQGGLMSGDRMAVISANVDGARTAIKVINITSLLGRWQSIDKNFEIEEGGTVKSYIAEETSPWSTWKIFNGNLVLNRDTFIITELGVDTLYIENDKGIYVYERK